eukprot:TRINITY_DN69235_c0_g1_i1.p1 TRINITY_DN69235_c0_g1~~TRINITY_DN69235_c0_g1_i1.p1  ORF type:complete len:358 (-),score=44.20 TRINITY_DN69235_c0_g1_i1:116-1189(-)
MVLDITALFSRAVEVTKPTTDRRRQLTGTVGLASEICKIVSKSFDEVVTKDLNALKDDRKDAMAELISAYFELVQKLSHFCAKSSLSLKRQHRAVEQLLKLQTTEPRPNTPGRTVEDLVKEMKHHFCAVEETNKIGSEIAALIPLCIELLAKIQVEVTQVRRNAAEAKRKKMICGALAIGAVVVIAAAICTGGLAVAAVGPFAATATAVDVGAVTGMSMLGSAVLGGSVIAGGAAAGTLAAAGIAAGLYDQLQSNLNGMHQTLAESNTNVQQLKWSLSRMRDFVTGMETSAAGTWRMFTNPAETERLMEVREENQKLRETLRQLEGEVDEARGCAHKLLKAQEQLLAPPRKGGCSIM